MKLSKLLNRYEYKCNTCQTKLNNILDIYVHKEHDIRAKEKLKYFLLDIAVDFGMIISVMSIFTWLVFIPLIEKLAEVGAMTPI